MNLKIEGITIFSRKLTLMINLKRLQLEHQNEDMRLIETIVIFTKQNKCILGITCSRVSETRWQISFPKNH